MSTKACVICKDVLAARHFNRKAGSKDGLQPHCRECNRRASRAYYARNREKHKDVVAEKSRLYLKRNRDIVLRHLASHPCVDCGEADVVVLEFDHIRGRKIREVQRLAARCVTPDVLHEEIAKCEVRCVNCHRVKTARQQGSWRSRL
ncbi:MAG: hypothetical protein KF878_18650 [Planctomycetes bacterium]|nr:hypothetical protein [Planctomycetota bacterium]